MKTATISASNFKGSPTAPQHIRQITIQQQVQQRKLQRVTPIGQVMVRKNYITLITSFLKCM